MFDAFLLHLGFEEHLERHNKLGLFLPGQVHVAKLPFAQRPPNLKVINGEYSPGGQTRGVNSTQGTEF